MSQEAPLSIHACVAGGWSAHRTRPREELPCFGLCHEGRTNAYGGCGENVVLDRLVHRAAGWKELGVRVEGLMARGVGADQEQKWTEDPQWKETTGPRSRRGAIKGAGHCSSST